MESITGTSSVDLMTGSEARKFAEAEMKKLGIETPIQPKISREQLLFPADITAIPDKELGQLMSKYTTMIIYVETQVALAGIDSHCAAATLDLHGKKKLMNQEFRLKFDKVTDARAMRDIDPAVVKMQSEVLKLESLHAAIKSILEGFKTAYNTVSREISRRGSLQGMEGKY